MSKGYIATARIELNKPLDLCTMRIDPLILAQFEYIRVENNGLSVRTKDMPIDYEPADFIRKLAERLEKGAVIRDAELEEIFPGPNVSFTFGFSTTIHPKYVSDYDEHVRKSGFPATIYHDSQYGGTQVRYIARIGLFATREEANEVYNKMFTARFRYSVHTEDPLPAWDGGPMLLSQATVPKHSTKKIEVLV